MEGSTRHVRRRHGWRAALALMLALGGAGCSDDDASNTKPPCAASMQREFAAVASAQRETLTECVHRIGGKAPGFSPTACIAGDSFGSVQRAMDHAARAEQQLCSGPEVGYTSAAIANHAAVEAGDTLVRGLFGRDLDATLIASAGDPAAVRCQREVLDEALICSARSLDAYVDCAESVLHDGTGTPFDLVACKRLPDGSDCDAAIADTVSANCNGLATAALFPGCAGDLGRCARDHAERSTSLAINQAAGLCVDVLIGSLPEDTLLRCFAPPALEPIEEGPPIPMPDGVNPQQASWDDSGERLLFNFTSPTTVDNQLGSIRLDGSDFRCLTCGSEISGNLKVAQRFRDGRRLLVAGNNNPNPRWFVLECTPSVMDCQTSTLLRIQLPQNPDPATPILQYRVPHVTFDDRWFIWTEVRLRGPGGVLSAMGRLVRADDRYVIEDARVIAPPIRSLEIGTDSDVWRNFTQPFEAKEAALRGGLDWVEAGTPEAGHYDNFAIDLTNGAVRRMSRYPDHNEGVNLSADEQWTIVSSARTDNRVEFLGLLPRPPYIDWIAFSVHFVAIAGAPNDGLSPGGNPNERDCYLDPWMIDRWFERGDYIGQRLLKPADGWQSAAGGFEFSPDGTRISVTELQWRRITPPDTTVPGRLRILTLRNRDPIDPAAVVPIVDTPEPSWAVRYEDWIVPNTFGPTVIPGKAGGRATITNEFPTTLTGSARVEYERYSDDGASYLDGFEEIRIPVVVLDGAQYEVDLSISGAHQGTMRGALEYDFVRDINSGEVVTSVDGRTLSGPKTCYEAGLIPVP